jgi:hypothetical protein
MHKDEWKLPESSDERLIDSLKERNNSNEYSRKRGRLNCPMAV